MDGISIKAILLQAIGFLALWAFLKKFAFGPIQSILDQRAVEVQAVYDKANEALKSTEAARLKYEDHLSKIEQEAADRLAHEVRRGQEMADKLIQDAREESAREQEEARHAIREEFRRAKLDLRDFIAEATVQALGKVLRESVSKDQHQKVIEDYIDQIVEQSNN